MSISQPLAQSETTNSINQNTEESVATPKSLPVATPKSQPLVTPKSQPPSYSSRISIDLLRFFLGSNHSTNSNLESGQRYIVRVTASPLSATTTEIGESGNQRNGSASQSQTQSTPIRSNNFFQGLFRQNTASTNSINTPLPEYTHDPVPGYSRNSPSWIQKWFPVRRIVLIFYVFLSIGIGIFLWKMYVNTPGESNTQSYTNSTTTNSTKTSPTRLVNSSSTSASNLYKGNGVV